MVCFFLDVLSLNIIFKDFCHNFTMNLLNVCNITPL